MEIIKASEEHMEEIESIYADARRFMRENGNLLQWSNGYPQRDVIAADIKAGNLYVCTDGDEICAVFCFFIGNDPTYARIYNGKWLNGEPYGVIHRIALKSRGKGIASLCFDYAFNICKNLKIDTHRSNVPMQKALVKNGFRYCGVIFLPSGAERLAFQKCE